MRMFIESLLYFQELCAILLMAGASVDRVTLAQGVKSSVLKDIMVRTVTNHANVHLTTTSVIQHWDVNVSQVIKVD